MVLQAEMRLEAEAKRADRMAEHLPGYHAALETSSTGGTLALTYRAPTATTPTSDAPPPPPSVAEAEAAAAAEARAHVASWPGGLVATVAAKAEADAQALADKEAAEEEAERAQAAAAAAEREKEQVGPPLCTQQSSPHMTCATCAEDAFVKTT